MIKCGHCGGRHSTVLDVRNCSSTIVRDQKARAAEAMDYLETEGAPGHGLIGARERGEWHPLDLGKAVEQAERGRVATLPIPTQVTEAGMYRILVDDPNAGRIPGGEQPKVGRIFKVQRAVHGSGHLYAKELVEEWSGRLTDEVQWKFVYAPGAIKLLSAEDRMSLEDAKKFGALYGTCCVCGRTLTDEKSIERGIGPICAGKL